MIRRITMFLIVWGLLSAVPGLAQESDAQANPWWNDRVFYQIFVRSYYDSDGDGIGDINGLIEKLDYLNDGDPATSDDLGVTGLWLMPIFPSPTYHGYDVLDYRAINLQYGTLDDFRRLLDEAHARGIAVIIDLPLNHTSSFHPWFVESMNPESDYADWYIWVDEDPGYGGPWGQEVWHPAGGRYYYGVFGAEDGGVPDLNYDNPEVTAAMVDISRFWLEEVGVDGFRLDAIKYIVADGRVQENTSQNLAWLEDYRNAVKEIAPDALLVGEVWDANMAVPASYVGTSVDLAFEFGLATAMLQSADRGVAGALKTRLGNVAEAYPPGQWATFLTNHDQNRIMSQLNGAVEDARVAAAYLLTLPGVPFIYYGEEIGMQGIKPDEDIRLPMQWDDTDNAGFTTGSPWREPYMDFETVNAAAQTDDPDSLLSAYRDLIHVRNSSPAMRRGDLTLVESNQRSVVAFLRQYESESLLVLLNIADDAVMDYSLSLTGSSLRDGAAPVLLLGEGEPDAPLLNANGGFVDYVPVAGLSPKSVTIIRLSE
jgi:alpha-amylase